MKIRQLFLKAFGPFTNTTLDLPTNGVFNYTTITVDQGATLGFLRNLLNTPVHLLASGAVSAVGNITGSYIIGNGSLLTDINASNIVGAAATITFLSSA